MRPMESNANNVNIIRNLINETNFFNFYICAINNLY